MLSVRSTFPCPAAACCLTFLLIPAAATPSRDITAGPVNSPRRGSLSPAPLSDFSNHNSLEDSDSTEAYNLRAAPALPGWEFPAVPRAAPDARARNASVSPVLPGNAAGTWINYGIRLYGTQRVARLEYRVQVDDLFQFLRVETGDIFPGAYWTLNAGPLNVPGGRHTITLSADPENRIPEPNESDNVWKAQFVWSPLPLVVGQPLLRPVPPAPGDFPEPNCDGFAAALSPGLAWVIATAPTDPRDDYDLYLYDDYSGALHGFENRRAVSSSSGNMIDFVVGHRNGTPAVVYPGVVRFRAEYGNAFRIDGATSAGHTTTDLPARWENVSLAGSHLAEVYEGYFFEGVHYRLYLVRNAGQSDLSFNLYSPDDGGIYGRNDQALVAAGNDSADILEFDPGATGWHPVVVYRANGSSADKPVAYSFYWTTGVAGTGERPGEAASQPPAFRVGPNPMTTRATIEFTLAARGAVHLAVYDVLGRRTRLLSDGADFAAGRHVQIWDGRRDDGSAAPAGAYWVRLDAAGARGTREIIRSR